MSDHIQEIAIPTATREALRVFRVEGEMKGCDCLKKVNEALKARKSYVATTLDFSGGIHIQIATRKMEGKRVKPALLVASYCPFCGQKWRAR